MTEVFSKRNIDLANHGKKLVGYILAGYPDEERFFDVLKVCEEAPVDIMEIGFPSRDPYSDGEVISKAHGCVNKDVACDISYWRRIRGSTKKAIWMMGYRKDLIESGIYRQFAKERVVDGFVIPDIDNESRMALAEELSDSSIDVVGFANPGMSIDEFSAIFSNFNLVYEQLYVGQTGNSSESIEMYHPMLNESKKHPNVISFAGFGISRKEQVIKMFREGFDGAIIGTAIIKHLNESLDSMRSYLLDIGEAKSTWN